MDYYGGRFTSDNETSLYQPGGKPLLEPKKEPKIEPEDSSVLLDSSIQRVMKKNRELQKKLNDTLEENKTLKAQNTKMRSKLNLD